MDGATFGERISALRQKQRLSIPQLAAQTHTSEDTVAAWEDGTAAPDLASVHALAKILNIPPAVLIGGVFPEDSAVSAAAPQQDTVTDSVFPRPSLAGILSIILACVGFLAAAVINFSLSAPHLAFAVGSSICLIGTLCQLSFFLLSRKKATAEFRVRRAELVICANIVLFSTLLPLRLLPERNTALIWQHWLIDGGIFAIITFIACLIAVRIIHTAFGFQKQRSRNDPVFRLRRFFCIILSAALLITALFHLLLGFYFQNTKVLYGEPTRFTSWNSFLQYMQKPLASDGESELTLLTIQQTGNDLSYHYTDPDGNQIVIQTSVSKVLAADGTTVLCSYLHINQFVYDVSFSHSDDKLPALVYTEAQHQKAVTIVRTMHLVFCLIYLLEIATVYLLCRRRVKELHNSTRCGST